MAGIDSYTILAIHGNGADASTNILDSSPSHKTITPVDDAQIDTAQYKWVSSVLLDGAGDYLTVPHSIDWYFDADVCIDFNVRFAALPTAGNSMTFAYQNSDANNLWLINLYNDSGTYQWQFLLRKSATNVINMLRDTTLLVDTWYHIAWSRSGNDFRFFQGGTQLGSTLTDTNTFDDLTGDLYIGVDGSGSSYVNGWIDELRISKGTARWAANFTPETTEYSAESILTEGLGVSDSFTTNQSMLTEGVGLSDTFSVLAPTSITEAIALNDTFTPQKLQYTLTEEVALNDTFTPQMLQKTLTEEVGLNDGWLVTLLNRSRRKKSPVLAKGQRISFKFENSVVNNGLHLLDVKFNPHTISRPNRWDKIICKGSSLSLKFQNSTIDEAMTLEDVLVRTHIITGR